VCVEGLHDWVMSEIRNARPDEVDFTLTWRAESGQLTGVLEAVNVCDHPVRLANKPRLVPMGVDGRPLDAEQIISMEMKIPGYVDLGPGERASAPVSWAGWDGPPASGRVIVGWHGGRVEVEASGPRQPESVGPPTNLSSSWFERAD
jgi:Protein of unknown function (DUF4232)